MKRPAYLLASTVVLAARAAAADPAIPPNLAVYGDGGLQLGSVSLFKDPVSGAVVDKKQDLIWFESKGTLEVIDLRDPARAPVVIATKLPTDGFQIQGVSETSFQSDYIGVYIRFDFGKKPSATAEEGLYYEVDEDGNAKIKKKAKKISIVGKKWIAAQQGRKANTLPADRADPPHVTIPQSFLDQCEEADVCGTTAWVGGSPYQTLVVNHSCGDACHVACVLYDPAKKTYASPLADGGWGPLTDKTTTGDCGFDVEPGNARYAGGSKLCTLGAKMTCTDLGPWTELAWIPTTPAKAP
jgi:hypothetical protein